MLAWICRVIGHRWRYGCWQLFAFDRPLDIWKRDIECKRCGEERWQTTRSGFKPLDVC